MKKMLPGRFAHLLAIPLTLLLTLTLFLTSLCWQGVRVLTDRELHVSVALNPAVTDAQLARIDAHGASADAESLHQYSLEVIDWWMGLLQPDPFLDAPYYDGDVVQETVLPIRTQLLNMALPMAYERVNVPALVNFAAKTPAITALVSVVLSCLILLLMQRRMCKGLMYLGVALAASGLTALALMGGVLLLNPCGLIAQGSELLALQAGLLGQAVALQLAIVSAAEIAAGIVFIGVHQKRMRRFYAGSIAA